MVGPAAGEGVVRCFCEGGRGGGVGGWDARLAAEVEDEEVEAEGEADHDAGEDDVAEAEHCVLGL